MKKVQISINHELLGRIDDFCKNNYITRSSFLSLVSSQFLIQNNNDYILSHDTNNNDFIRVD